jgi:DNA-directed RNA polymerase subunit RPC12/RpoP
MSERTTEKYRCVLCAKEFRTAQDLEDHLLEEHPNERTDTPEPD